jgi:uncharacterized protein
MAHALDVDRESLAALCRRQGIRRLALFGSASRGEEGSDSDIDFLVEFEPGQTPGLIRLASLEMEFGRLLGGREVELRTYEDLSRFFRDEVQATATPIYDAA